MIVSDNEIHKLANRELEKDQYSGYQFLFDGINCPHFATLHKKNNEKTRGRFATDLWTSGTRKYVEVNSGSPAIEGSAAYVSKAECGEFAQSIGETFIDSQNNENDLPGCYNPSNTNVIYNSNFGNNNNYDCSLKPCVQWTDNDPKNMDGEVIRSSGHALLQKKYM